MPNYSNWTTLAQYVTSDGNVTALYLQGYVKRLPLDFKFYRTLPLRLPTPKEEYGREESHEQPVGRNAVKLENDD